MKKIVTSEKIPIKLWLDDIEEGALKQAQNLANLPFAFKHIALMPDSHEGFGMPIGGVLATNGAVVSNAVGVDIGCGVSILKTDLLDLSIEDRKSIMNKIREFIPLGFNHHEKNQEWEGFSRAPDIQIIRQELDSARKQLGTLGGGNHFISIESGKDLKTDSKFVYLMLHSGSRNFGLKVAKAYHEKAQQLCDRWFSNIPSRDLSFLPIETNEAKEYFEAMNYALDFAKENRAQMMEAMKKAVSIVRPGTIFSDFLDIHHNYAAWENHFGQNVIVHRKGATSAQLGQLGIIPGSQGTKSYIVKGKGNPESFMSCSHGAGRAMGRKVAQKTLNLEAEIKLLNDQGIVHSIRHVKDLDEATSAYKDIQVVMNNQEDLVDKVVELSPLAVIKGT